jgi:hypothetical protein
VRCFANDATATERLTNGSPSKSGYQAGSLALLMDSVHNLSDEMALVFLYLAFILSLGVFLLRSANVFNSVGLIAVSALLCGKR